MSFSLLKITPVLIILSFLAVLLLPAPALGETPNTDRAVAADNTARAISLRYRAKLNYRGAISHRKRADRIHHMMRGSHDPFAHGKMKFTGHFRFEVRRRIAWRNKANRYARMYRTQVRNCVNAGFPRWYCPTLMKATFAEGVQSYRRDTRLAFIMRREAGFRPCVINGGRLNCNYRGPRAWGMFQFLSSTWAQTGIRQTSNVYWQTRAGLRYIKRRYGGLYGAHQHWLRHHWY